MAQRVEIRNVTIPPGTLQSTPQTTNLVWREGIPERVEIRFPPGPSGLVGVQLMHSGVVVIPHRGSAFLITDDEIIDWDLDGYSSNANWALHGFNTGNYSHTIQIRMHLNDIGARTVPSTPGVLIEQQRSSSGVLSEGSEVS